ncbi:MAG: hypothetical protein ACAH20_18220 [Methylobacteriaceae bacterium]
MSAFSNFVWVAVLALPLILIGIGAHMAGADQRARSSRGEASRRG